MDKTVIIVILSILLVVSLGFGIYSYQKGSAPAEVKEVIKEVIKEVPAASAPSDEKLCDQIPIYTGSFGDGSLSGLYPNVAQDVCRLAFAVDKSSVEICKSLKGPAEVHGMCYSLIASKTGDETVCEGAAFEARDRCYLSIAQQTGDVSACEKIRSVNEKENCITNYVSRTGDVEGCKKITTANGRDNCYMNQAYRDPSLCDKITNSQTKQSCKSNVGR
ncbi:MAG: hypothetical protein A2939_01735 [Parcubacteria group bacterium RIFCSPLOWO2_01_FULL_48_18]|nr:MAG: hypothetical protein A3J67_04950 [Parcubacteria group bacterium RIFCSPHIGHO2_02_FULL_48_10b]OHB21799.1 MAG: hypothetical protein A2939_01735 [Parcubacteria group bacterium RIFCSPLOWO2_01_FULL_48_18]